MTQIVDSPRDRKGRRLSKRIRTGDIIVVILFLAIILMLIQFDFTELLAIVYHPVAGLLILVVIIEFLWLKSGDRTRIYKLEIDKLRRIRREDEELLRRAQQVIKESLSTPGDTGDGRPGDWHRKASDLRSDLDDRL